MNNRLLIIFLIVIGLTAHSQTNQCLHFGGNVGINSLIYKIEGGASKPRLSYGGNLGYIYFFNPNWGIGTGAGAYSCTTDGYLNGALISVPHQFDDEGDEHTKLLYFRDWVERQKFLLLEFPLFGYYQYNFSAKARRVIYVRLGVKAQLPMMGRYEVTKGQVAIQGFYEKWNVILHNDVQTAMDIHGFGKERVTASAKMELPFEIAASFGIGFSFEVTKMVDIYVGGSFEYGFLNLKKGGNEELLYLDNNQVRYRGILNSSITQKANLVAAQGEVGMRIALGKTFARGGIRGYKPGGRR